MVVLQINVVYKTKSTGRTYYEVQNSILKDGDACYTAFGYGSDYGCENVYRINTKPEYYFHNLMSRVTGLQGYFSFFATKRLIKYIKKISPDIIQLGNIHGGVLNMPSLFKFLKQYDKPVVLNLHDCWAFTGKCAHYTDNKCYKWKTGCHDCPAVHRYPASWFFDFSKKMYKDKVKWFNGIRDLTVVGVSDWTAEQGRMSFLKNREVLRIYNWINMDVFHPYDGNVLQEYNIPDNKFTVICVASMWILASRKVRDLIKLSLMLPDDMQIVLVGHSKDKIDVPSVYHIPFVDDTTKLAKLYSSCDAYVHLSTEDTFGKVIAEALSCGTPAIVYNSTACPEIIGPECGYVVEPKAVEETFDALMKIKARGKAAFSASCVKFVQDNFNYSVNVEQKKALYRRLTEKK